MELIAQLALSLLLVVGSTGGGVGDADSPPAAVGPEVPTEALRADLIDAGYTNGRLPADALTEIESSRGCLFERAAGDAWRRLEADAAADGIELVARWCYRNLATQRATYERNCPLVPVVPIPDPAADHAGVEAGAEQVAAVKRIRRCSPPTAKPGNSNHGWGRAVDVKLEGRLLTCQSPAFLWLTENAPRYGWVHPPWAGCGEPKEEPWHWEWGGLPEEPTAHIFLAELAAWLEQSRAASKLPDPGALFWRNAFLRGAEAR